MLTLVLLVIGFLITGGTFGAGVIGAFGLAQYWMWFIAIFLTIIGVLIIVASSSVGASFPLRRNKLQGFAGVACSGVIGAIIAAVLVVMSYVQLWLSYYIVEHTPLEASGFSELPGNTQVAIVAFFAMLIMSIRKTKIGAK